MIVTPPRLNLFIDILMRKFKFVPLAFAALLAVAAPGIPSGWALPSAGTVSALKSQLPAGVSLSSATISETASALGAAVAAHPESAVGLTEAAILAKTPKKGHGTLSCQSLTKIVNAAVNAAPEKSSDVIQMALSLHPQCADELNALLTNPEERVRLSSGGNAPDGFKTPNDEYAGFGVGFGPGFPGSPGFSGSTPSGAIALPPEQVTSVLNG